jgi:hypothetical protein
MQTDMQPPCTTLDRQYIQKAKQDPVDARCAAFVQACLRDESLVLHSRVLDTTLTHRAPFVYQLCLHAFARQMLQQHAQLCEQHGAYGAKDWQRFYLDYQVLCHSCTVSKATLLDTEKAVPVMALTAGALHPGLCAEPAGIASMSMILQHDAQCLRNSS